LSIDWKKRSEYNQRLVDAVHFASPDYIVDYLGRPLEAKCDLPSCESCVVAMAVGTPPEGESSVLGLCHKHTEALIASNRCVINHAGRML
jgi:hypothetical protein